MRDTRVRRIIVVAATTVAVVLLLYFPDRDDGSGAVLGGFGALIAVPLGLDSPCAVSIPAEAIHGRARQADGVRARSGGRPGLGQSPGQLGNVGVETDHPRADGHSMGPLLAVVDRHLRTDHRGDCLSARPVKRVGVGRRSLHEPPANDHLRALGVSSLLFGVAHIFYGGVDDPLYAIGMAVKSAAAGWLLGWVFWRWGLPYSIVCHCTANGIHLLVMPIFFDS